MIWYGASAPRSWPLEGEGVDPPEASDDAHPLPDGPRRSTRTSSGRRNSTGCRSAAAEAPREDSKPPRRTAASCSRRSRNVSPKSGTSSCEENAGAPDRSAHLPSLPPAAQTPSQKGGLADFPTNGGSPGGQGVLDSLRRREEAVTPSPGPRSRAFPQGCRRAARVGDPLPEIFRGGDHPPEAVIRPFRRSILLQCTEIIAFIRTSLFSP